MDCEGDPVQELSALAMDSVTHQIVSVYHKHAFCNPEEDAWCRINIHGLNPDFLKDYGFHNDDELIIDFKKWLQCFNVTCIYANNPSKERQLLPNHRLRDICIPIWEIRMKQPYHETALRFKQLNVPIGNVRCSNYVHSRFITRYYIVPSRKELGKILHGFHCALYDCYELYLFYLFEGKNL